MTTGKNQPASMKKPLPPTYLLSAIVLMTILHFLFPWRDILTGLWRLLGVVPFLIGLIMNLAADRLFKQHETTVKPFEKSAFLIVSGVYRVSRNPMYLGFVLVLLGIATIMGSLSPWIVVPVFAVLMDVVFIQTEERMMAAEFGESWLAYKARVRRWL